MINLGDVVPFEEDEFMKKSRRQTKLSRCHSNNSVSIPFNVPRQHNCPSRNASFGSFPSDDSNSSYCSDFESIRKQNIRLRKQRDKAVSSLKVMHLQQQKIRDDFQLLRDKYDDLKLEMHRILWDYIPRQCTNKPISNNPCYNELLHVDPTIFETSSRIGDYTLGPLLGEGQFADVKLCTYARTKKQYAVKVLQKSKVVTLANLQRIQTEIDVLRKINHPNIVSLVNVIHSPQSIYVITELAGKDLFDFFDVNPMGVNDEIAREIVLGIVEPIVYLHSLGICHRDLKPENILLFFNPSTCLRSNTNEYMLNRSNIQICDFGQSAQNVKSGECTLNELCGSPGFFAPEMILGRDRYDGTAADIWSIGCIMLELTRGHNEFCSTWMTCYDYEVLQDETKFKLALTRAIRQVNEFIECDISNLKNNNEENSMIQFINDVLTIDPIQRIDSQVISSHPWLCDQPSRIINEENKKNQTVNDTAGCEGRNEYFEFRTKYNKIQKNDAGYKNAIEATTDQNRLNIKSNANVTQSDEMKKTRFLRDSMSNRARRHFSATFELVNYSDSNKDQESNPFQRSPPPKKRFISNSVPKLEFRLPPIEKLTPSRENICTSLIIDKGLKTDGDYRITHVLKGAPIKKNAII